MHIDKIEKALFEIVEDSNITADEKHELRDLAASISPDKLRFIRNRAFDLAKSEAARSPHSATHTLKWLERLLKAIDLSGEDAAAASDACFSPGDDCRNKLLDLIGTAKKQIDICVFTISDDRLTEEIMAAHKRGVYVRVITDNDKSSDRGSDIFEMVDFGIRLRMDRTADHMHHKFMLVDQSVLANGSFNWTRSASEKNHENILVTGDQQLVAAYQDKFEELWKLFA